MVSSFLVAFLCILVPNCPKCVYNIPGALFTLSCKFCGRLLMSEIEGESSAAHSTPLRSLSPCLREPILPHSNNLLLLIEGWNYQTSMPIRALFGYCCPQGQATEHLLLCSWQGLHAEAYSNNEDDSCKGMLMWNILCHLGSKKEGDCRKTVTSNVQGQRSVMKQRKHCT